MKRVRISILSLLGIVALAAADCLALRWLYVRGNRSILLLLGLLPLINVLLVGGLVGLRSLVTERRCPSFLVGLQAFGWGAAAAFSIACAEPSSLDRAAAYFAIVLAPVDGLIRRWGFVYNDTSIAWQIFESICSSAALSIPLLAFALFGGWFTRHFEIWLARGVWLARAEQFRESA